MPVTQEDLDELEEYCSALESIDVGELDYEGFDPEYTRCMIKERGSYDKKVSQPALLHILKEAPEQTR